MKAPEKPRNQGTKYSKRLGHAREEAAAAVQLKNDISTLSSWLKNDILSVTGPDLASRQELLDFVVDELKSREALSSHRIRPVHRLLERQGENLYSKIGARFYDIQEATQSLIEKTVRASSIVENLNSRLRNYFFLRKTLGSGYLELLQFFLNHCRFMCSALPERGLARVQKSY